MKPYSPKRKGSTRGHVSCTSKCATRERAIRQDKKAARRIGGANSGKLGSWRGASKLADDEYSSSAGYGGWGHDE